MLAGDIGARSLTRAPAGLLKSAEYIEYVFKKAGYAPESQYFNTEVISMDTRKSPYPSIQKTRNIIAEIKGNTIPDEIIIVGAHYDTEYDSPGANDNASGVAALLELSKLLLLRGSLERTIRFVAFTNEEQPYSRTNEMGSRQYANACHRKGEQINAMLCLETIGYYTNQSKSQRFPSQEFDSVGCDKANFITFISSNIASEPLLKNSIPYFRDSVRFPSLAFSAPETMRPVDFSDHQNFWSLGYPAIMITDTAYFRYEHYHASTDTPDKICFDQLAVLTDGICEVIQKLSSEAKE